MHGELTPDSLTFLSSTPERRSRWALMVLFLIIGVMVGRIQEVIPGLSNLYLGKVALGLAAVAYLATPWMEGVSVWSFPQIRYLLYLFVIGLCSTPFSKWPGGSFNFLVFGYLSSLLMVLLLLKVVDTFTDLRKVLWSIMVFLIVLGVAAMFSGGGERVTASGTYDPNDLSLLIAVYLPIMYYYMSNSKGFIRLILLLANLFLIAVLASTQSRTGFIAFCVVTLIVLVRERVNIGRIVLGALSIVMVLTLFAPSGLWERLRIIGTEEDYNIEAGGGRIEVWKRGFEIIAGRPLLGVGPNVFAVAEGQTHYDEQSGTSGKWSTAHNSYIQVAAEFGLPAFVVYMMTLMTSIRSLRELRKKHADDTELQWVTNGLEISFYSFMVGSLFLSQAYSAALFLLIGLSMVVLMLAQHE